MSAQSLIASSIFAVEAEMPFSVMAPGTHRHRTASTHTRQQETRLDVAQSAGGGV